MRSKVEWQVVQRGLGTCLYLLVLVGLLMGGGGSRLVWGQGVALQKLPPKAMSLRLMLETLIQRNPDLAREQLSIQQAHADVTVARGAFTFDLDIGLSLNRSELPVNMQGNAALLGSIAEISLQDLRLEGSVLLSKRFEYGTLASVRLSSWWRLQDQLDFAKALQGGSDPVIEAESASNSLTLQIVQPLLQGAWRRVNLAPIWQAQERVKVVQEQRRKSIEQLFAQAVSAYWDAVFAKQNLQTSREALQLVKRQIEMTHALIQAGRLPKTDIFQVKQAAVARQLELSSGEDAFEQALNRVRVLLFLPKGHPIDPTEPLMGLKNLRSLDGLLRESMTWNPDLRIARKLIKVAEWSIVTSRNAVLPQLNLEAGFTFVGFGRKASNQNPPPGNPIGGAWGTLFDPRSNSMRVGITLKIPLDNRRAKFRLERNRLEVGRARMLEANLKRRISLQVRQLYRMARRVRLRIPLSQASVKWSKKKLEAEQKKLQLGKSTVFNVLRFQQDLVTARRSIFRNAVDYQKAYLAVMQAAGLLFREFLVKMQGPTP